MGARQWLSEGAEVLVRGLQASAAQAHDCDVLVVGSGYGGAVAACRLAGARERDGGRPARVFVLERGREYLPGMFPSRFADLPGHVRFSAQDGRPPRGRAEGLFDVRMGDTSVVLANGLGGGSLINAAVMARIRPGVLDARWPSAIDAASLEAAYATVERMLQVDDFSTVTTPPKLASLQALGRAMGAGRDDIQRARLAIRSAAGATQAGVARDACLYCGDCVTGCNHAAKNSLDVNYLKLAHDRGVRMFCGVTVHRLERRPEGETGWRVHAAYTDPSKGYAEPALFTVRARRVVLAAGALGSTEILLRSQRHGVALSSTLGEGFSGNGDMIAVAWRQQQAAHCSAREEDVPKDRAIGPTINGMVFRRPDREPGEAPARELLFQEFAIPAPLRRVLGEVTTTFSMLHALRLRPDDTDHRADFTGPDPAAVDDDAIEHTAVFGAIGDDGAGMMVILEDGEPGGTPSPDRHPIDARVRICGDAGAAAEDQLDLLQRGQAADPALDGLVVPNPLWMPLSNLPLHRSATVHPLGGSRMADGVDAGTVDDCGRVYDPAGGVHPGLAVLDGSIVPCALGVNPALTIAALAERAMPRLMDTWRLDAAAPFGQPAAPGVAQPRWSDAPPAARPRPTAVELRERMTGTLRLGGVDFEARLTVAFERIDDVRRWTRRLPRHVALPSATLELTARDGTRATVVADGVAQVLHRADATAAERIAAATPFVEDGSDDESSVRALRSHAGEVRTIDYRLQVRRVDGPVALVPGDGLRLTKRLTLTADGASPWRQLSDAAVTVDSRSGSHEAGRLCLDPNYFVEQAMPLLRVLSQQDQPNALGDVGELALLVARLALKIRWPDLLFALQRSLDLDERLTSKATERMPGPFRYRLNDVVLTPRVETHAVDATTPARLTRFRPPDGPSSGRPVLLIHGLGASGSTFAHASIGARTPAGGELESDNLVAALLRARRDVWVLELRTSIALEQREHVTMEAVAMGDIGAAMHALLSLREREGAAPDERVDVVAHCIGAAMFCVAALGGARCGPAQSVHERVGSVVLSQVGPLMRMGAMNRFRGYVASYLRQFVGAQVFDVRPPPTPRIEDALARAFQDALLSTFPYPAGDRERERAEQVPCFEVVRHRADAIWGRLMELDNVGDATLGALDAIYGWVVVQTLAQTIHFARHALITDASGFNRVVAHENFAQRFDFPVLLLHGERNAMFDWQGAWDSLHVLKQVFADTDGVPAADPPLQAPAHVGAGTPRQLRVVRGYGHQDCLIGQRSHADVFPAIVGFLDETASRPAAQTKTRPPEFVADLPWMGPMLGWVRAVPAGGELRLRLGLRASPARANTLALVLVPARLQASRWTFDLDQAAAKATTSEALRDDAVEVALSMAQLARHDGLAVLTVHTDLPVQRTPRIRMLPGDSDRLILDPRGTLPLQMREAVQRTLDTAGDHVAFGIVRLDPAWMRAADTGEARPADALSFALGSCQYPAGLLDKTPAAQSCERLLRRLDAADDRDRPQLLMLLGDQVYVDETAGLFDPQPQSDDVMRTYDLAWRAHAFRAVARRLPAVAMLDDHEVSDNWEPGRPVPATAALQAYRVHQQKLAPQFKAGKASPALHHRFHPAGFPVFLLDARSARQARVLRGEQGVALDDARIVPDATLAALAQWLDGCPKDAPKFIASPSVVLPLERSAVHGDEAERLGLDSWSGFPASLSALLQLVARGRHQHVVFLSGDAHLSLVCSLDVVVDGQPPVCVHSVVSSGLYAPWPFANSPAADLLLDGDVAFRHRGAVAFSGTMTTAAIGTGQGFARVDVQRVGDGRWQLRVALDLADEVMTCERQLGADGPMEPWRVSRAV